MKVEEIESLAWKAGFSYNDGIVVGGVDDLVVFVGLILDKAAAECKIVANEDVVNASSEYSAGRAMGATICADMIRRM